MIKILMKMKKLSLIILTVCSMFAFGQKVSDYKYISLPVKLETFKEDFGLGEMLTKTLRSKNYIVVPFDKLQWPSEAQSNPCNVLTANILNDSGFLRNKVLLQFKDCNDKVISSIKGASNIKEFKEGYQDALKQTFTSISPANPTIQPIAKTEISRKDEPAKEEVKEVRNQSTGVEVYAYNGLKFQKVKLSNDQFILVDNNNPTPFATFSATGKGDVFRVKLENGTMAIGYYEYSDLVLEATDNSGQTVKYTLKRQ
jgi:hypothetical protein